MEVYKEQREKKNEEYLEIRKAFVNLKSNKQNKCRNQNGKCADGTSVKFKAYKCIHTHTHHSRVQKVKVKSEPPRAREIQSESRTVEELVN